MTIRYVTDDDRLRKQKPILTSIPREPPAPKSVKESIRIYIYIYIYI